MGIIAALYKILVVDDEEKIIQVIQSYLEHEGFQVLPAINGTAALQLFDREAPDLVILDLMLPDISGEEICRTLRKKSRVPIIMLTAKVAENDLLQGLAIGADDYLTKPFSPRELVARVQALLRRSGEEPMPLANSFSFFSGDLTINSFQREVKKQGQPVNLTPNEYKMLMTLIKYPHKIFTRNELIAVVLGEDFEGYDRTVDTHIKNLRHKIETDPKNPQYIITSHGIGYRFGGD